MPFSRPSSLMVGLLLPIAAAAAEPAPGVSLTVYSSAQPGQLDSEQLAHHGSALPGYGVVSDHRRMVLEKGRSTVRFDGVAARMDPSTVAFSSLTDPDGTRVLEQDYQFDLVSGDKLLQRYLGETISVEHSVGEGSATTTGELLSAQGGLTLRLPNGEIATFSSWTAIRFPSLPGGLIIKPTLLWLLDAERGGPHLVRVSYQARAMTWWADYNVVLDESRGCSLSLSSWVTVVNQSGAGFEDAQLKLVAGEVNRAPPPPPRIMYDMAVQRAAMPAAAEAFQESGLFEYHLYTLGRRTTLPDNSTKQLELLPAADTVACRKELVFTAAPKPMPFHGTPQLDQGYAASSDGQVGAWLEFDNEKSEGLGVALPAGRVRVNQLSADGALEFIGEDVIGHTPRNETVRVRLGTSFDVVGERRQTAFELDSKARWAEESFEVEVRNRKEEAVKVLVREYLYRWSDWRIRDENIAHVRRDAQTVDFPVQIPADGKATVRYTVRYEW